MITFEQVQKEIKSRRKTAPQLSYANGFHTLKEVMDITGMARTTLSDLSKKDPEKLQLYFDAAKWRKIMVSGDHILIHLCLSIAQKESCLSKYKKV